MLLRKTIKAPVNALLILFVLLIEINEIDTECWV